MSSEAVFRVLLVLAVAGGAVALGTAWRRRARPRQRPVDVAGLALASGVVIFTSTACANCAGARRRLEELELPIREVTWELEPTMFEEAGVETVPLVVFLDGSGAVTAQFSGVPPRTALRAAAAAVRG